MDNISVISIMNYIDECLFQTKTTWSKEEIERRSYSRWAADEILCSITEHPFHSVTDIIEGFIFKMLYFSYIEKGDEKGSRFIIAMNMAEDILFLCRR